MANPKLLLVDADPRSIRVLGVSLRSSGYRVTTSGDAIDALAKAESIAPDLVLCDTRLPKTDGYAFVRALRARPESARIPVILLSIKDSAEDRKRAAELGVQDFLTKPVVVGELLARMQLVLARRLRESIAAAPHGPARFSGSTQELPMVDLLQTFDETGRSGVVHLRSGVQEAELYFRDGRVVDAELGRLRGEEAVYRVLMWRDASFEIELKTITLENVVGGTTDEITMEGMRRLDAWGLLRERLQPVASLFEVDHAQVLEQLNGVVRLLDVNKSPSEAGGDQPFELSALSSITRGLLVPGPDASAPAVGIEDRRIAARASETAHAAPASPSPLQGPVHQAVHASAPVHEELEQEEQAEDEHRTSGHAPSAPFFGEVVPETEGAAGGASLLPTTREVRSGAEPPIDDDMAAAGVPRVMGGRKRFATATVAIAAIAAALLAPVALRTLRTLQSPDGADTRMASARAGAPVEIAPPEPALPAVPAPVAPAAEIVPPPAPPEVPAPQNVAVPPQGSLPAMNAPAPGLAASLALPAGGHVSREKALDTNPTAGGQSPAVLAAEKALMQGKTEEGLALARQASIDNPADAEAWLTLAAANAASGNTAGAREAYGKCVSQAHTASVTHCRVLSRMLASK